MNIPSLSPAAVERQVRCWCGNARLEDFSPDYWRCAECETLVLRAMRGEEVSQVRDDEQDLYGKSYYLQHLQQDYGYPDLETRARADLPERCLHWLRTLLKFVSGPGARTLELGCGHGGFVAMQRWAGLDATGLELSPWLVDRAREWFGIPVLQGRLEDQDLPAGSYDAVALMDVLEHLPNPRQTLGRAVALLRSPSGFLLIQTPNYPPGVSYEEMRAQNHPFLAQLKPMEHLYLFSQGALARLCTELGVGEVRFEPAIFAHYDQYVVASAGTLRERDTTERTGMLMAASPPARWTLALLDLAEERSTAAETANLEADNAARLEVIERQGQEIGRLHVEVDQRLKEAAEFGLKLDAITNERNLLAAQCQHSEEDRAARLALIETQGTEIGELRAKLSNTGSELADLRGHFEQSEADRAARLKVIETQGATLGDLGAQLHSERDARARLAADLDKNRGALDAVEARRAASEHERDKLARELAEAHAAQNNLQGRYNETERERSQLTRDLSELHAQHAAQGAELEASCQRHAALERHWTGRWLKQLGLWPR